jgi:DNA-binding CsgD family transcriptional regulator
VFFGVSTVSSSWIASPGLTDDMAEFVSSGWAEKNTRMAIGLRKGKHLLGRFITEADYYDPEELEQEAIYHEFFYPKGLGHSAGTIAILPHEDMLCFSFEGPKPLAAEALARLDAIRPHLMRASLITARVGMEKIRTAIETLTAVGLPAAAVTQSGKVLLTNDSFATATNVWTTRGGDRIALLDTAADALLHDGLSALRLGQITRSVPIRATTRGPMTAVVQVVPVRRLALDIFGNSAAILVLSEPKNEQGDASLLGSLFDLTPTELEVARSIATGSTVKDIATIKNRSVSTVRNQLRAVMEKTGSSRQVDLALLLRSLR